MEQGSTAMLNFHLYTSEVNLRIAHQVANPQVGNSEGIPVGNLWSKSDSLKLKVLPFLAHFVALS